MPHALLQLPDVYESVIRRVAVAVTQNLARIMQLPETTAVYLPGNTDSVPMNGGVFGNCCASHITYPADSKLVVRYVEEANDNVTLTTGVNNKENLPIFNDPVHDVVIRPVWRYVNFQVTLEYTAPNITVAQRWLDEQRVRISMGRAEQYTEVEYHYALPRTLMALFRNLYDTMQASEFPSKWSHDDWILKHLTVPFTEVATLTGGNRQLAIVEKQMEVIGWFDFDNTPPTPERSDNGTGTYTATVAYNFRYNRPEHLSCRYPILMNQNPIPRELRNRVPHDSYREHLRRVSRTKFAFDTFLKSQEAKKLDYIHHPEGDEWLPPTYPKGRMTFFSGLVVLSKDDLRSVVDLAEMGPMKFTPWFLEYFYGQGNKLFTPGRSLVEFRLYENNTLLTNQQLEMVPGTTTVRSLTDLNPESYYHFQVSLVRNWYEVQQDTYLCLRRYPTVLYNLLQALGAKVPASPQAFDFLSAGRPRVPSTECPGEGTMLCTDQYPQLAWTQLGDQCPLVIRDGIVKLKVIEDALDQLDNLSNNLVNRQGIGPLNVLYYQILTFTNQG